MMHSTEQRQTRPRYIIVSPVRDEGRYLDTTIRCVIDQTIRPEQYILVDDGSSDDTLEIIQRWSAAYPWIIAVHRTGTALEATQTEQAASRGKRARAAKEILAFYEGFHRFAMPDWQFLVKLDGDVGIAPDYFERCFHEFAIDPKLGIGGGDICHLEANRQVVEKNPTFHVRGATKIYRNKCWEEIGGVTSGAGWDTLDELKANMLGWSTRSFSHLRVLHYRHTGAANGIWQNAVKKGEWNYISGYHPVFMGCKVLVNALKRPWLRGSAGLLYGYLRALLLRTPRLADRKLIRYIQAQQLRRLCYLPTIWR